MTQACCCLISLCVFSAPVYGQWRMTGSVGYSRAIQESGPNGGAAYSIGFSRSGPGLSLGIELGRFNLGSAHATFRLPGGLFPGNEPSIVTTEDRQSGWRLAATLELLTIGRFRWIGSAGFYRFTGEHSSEMRDTTGHVLRPRSDVGGTSNGAGLMTGIRIGLVRFSPSGGISVEATGHAVGLRSAGEDGGYSFFHYFTLAARVDLGL